MELGFDKLSNGQYRATSDDTSIKYLLTPTPNKQWEVKANREVLDTVKGIANAQAVAQAHEDSETEEEEEVKPTAKRGRSASIVTPTVTPNGKPIAKRQTAQAVSTSPVRKSAVPVITPTIRTKRVKPFPEFGEDWEGFPVKARRETAEAYASRVKGARLKHGRERAAYNRENGIDVTPTASTPKTRKPAEPKERQPRDFGDRWNDFPVPSDMQFAIARLNNARSSRDYARVFGGLHPYGDTAKITWYKAIERCATREQEIETAIENGATAPKGYAPEYYGNKLSDLPELDADSLAGYQEVSKGEALSKGREGRNEEYVCLDFLFERPTRRGASRK